MKKVLFPFSQKYKNLNKYWWHRFITVLFLLTVLFTGFYTWQSISNSRNNSSHICFMYVYDEYMASPLTAQGNVSVNALKQNDDGLKRCSKAYPYTPLQDSFIALLVALGVFYIFQVLYFTVVIYIIFGKNYDNKL